MCAAHEFPTRRVQIRVGPHWIAELDSGSVGPARSGHAGGTEPEETLGAVQDVPRSVSALVRVAFASDEPARLVAAASEQLGRPLALAGPAGQQLGRAPDTAEGDRAFAVARAAARSRLVAPPGWQIVAIDGTPPPPAFLAIGGGPNGPARPTDVELVASLLGEQLHRAALLRATVAALVRRLVSEQDLSVQSARRDAARIGLQLADEYWPAILGWRTPAPAPDVVESSESVARDGHPGVLVVMLGPRMVLMHPADAPDAGPRSREWQRAVAEHARRITPSSRPQVIAAEQPAGLGELAGAVAELVALWRLGPRPSDTACLVTARRFALESLLAHAAASPAAGEFVQRQIGSLIAWDREHHGDLLSVLETALDLPRHDRAAARCFMHRNTFRRRLAQAAEVLGNDLEDADARLAVHVALKLRRVLEARAAAEGANGGRRASATRRRPARR